MKHLFWVAILLTGCDNDMKSNSNPLVGSWKGTVGGGTLSLMIKSDMKYDEGMNSSDSSSGCKSALTFSGVWSSTATTVTATPSTGHLVVTECTDSADNMDRDTTKLENDAYTVTNVSYSISGNVLTMTMGGMPIELTRQ